MADRSVRVRLLADVQQYREGMRQAARETAAFGREVTANTDKANDALRDVGRGAIVAGAGLLAGFGIATAATLGFDRQLSELSAVSGATAVEMDALREAALEAGAATAFSASQAAQAQTELAKAGLSTADILGGALTGALDLAAAGDLDVARAAEIAAAAMMTFGLTGRDVTAAADALAAGANKSLTDVDTLSEALAQSGLVADQYGLSLQETVGTLSLFSQNTLNGSDAGTSFKTMLMRLGAPTAEARALMEQLGITVYDASGQMLGFDVVADSLQDALGGMSDAQRNAAMSTLFGADAIRAANIVVEAGGEGVRQWTDAVSESGFASDVAAEKLDNLAGDLEALRGSLETALIQGGSQATGALRFLAQTATGTVNAFANLPSPVQGAGIALAGLGGSSLFVAGVIGTAIPKLRDFRDRLDNLGPAGARAGRLVGVLGRVGGYAAGISATAGALLVLHEAAEAAFSDDPPNLDELALDLVKYGESGAVAGELLASFGTDLEGLADDLDELRASTSDWEQLGDFIGFGDDDAVERIDALDKALAGLVESGNRALARQILQDIHDQLGVTVPIDQWTLVGDHLGDYTDALARNETQSRLAGNAQRALPPVIDDVEVEARQAAEAVDAYANAVGNTLDPFFGLIDAEQAYADAQQGVIDAQRDAREAADDLVDAQADVADALAITADRAAAAEQGIQDLAAAERGQVDPLFAMVDALAGNQRAQRDARRANTPRERQEADLAVVQSAAGVEQAAIGLAGAIQTGQVSLADANASLAEWVAQGLLGEEQAARITEQFAQAAAGATAMEGANVAAAVSTAVAAAEAEAATERAERLADAQERVVDAQERLVEAQQAALTAQDDVTRSAQGLWQAQIDLGVAIATGNTSVATARGLLDAFADQGIITREEADRMGAQFETLAGKIGVVNSVAQVEVLIASNVGDVIDDIDELRTVLHEMIAEGTLVAIPIGLGAFPHATGGYAAHPEPAYLARGGFGPRGSDTIPAMLSPGEFVIRTAAANALGPDVLHALNHAERWTGAGIPTAEVRVIQVPVPERNVTEISAVLPVRQNVYEAYNELRTLQQQLTLTNG